MELVILHFFESLHTPVLDKIMYYLTMLGEKGIFWIIIALLFLFVLPKRYRKVGLTMAFALIFSIVISNLFLKNMIQRDRPFWADPTFENLFNYFDTIDDWSFPSGHTAASFGAAVAIRMWRKAEGNIAIIIAVLVALSRMYLTVHYPTDVLFSVILGIIYGIAAYYLTKWLINKFPKARRVFKGGQSYLTFFRPLDTDRA